MCSSTTNVKRILQLTLPLILSSLSANMMFMVDRMILAYYSIDSMNAAALGANLITLVSFTLVSIIQIATVFVGQYNGAHEFHKTSAPAWQMIYLALASFVICAPYAYFIDHLCVLPDYCKAEAIPYQQILLYVMPIPGMTAAISSFFIGINNGKIVTTTVVTGNIINAILGIIMVFGINGWFSPLGTIGAAFSTAISEFIQFVILALVFFNKKHKTIFNTTNYSFNKKLFILCIKTGIPVSTGKCLALLGWYIMFICFGYASKDLAIIESIMITIFVIFIFFADGCSKAIASITANFIGQNEINKAKEILKIFVKMNVIMSLIFSIPLIFYQELIFFFINKTNGDISHLYPEFSYVFYMLWITIFFDGIFYSISGLLSAGGDTKYVMYVEVLSIWCIVIIPTLIMFFTHNLTSIRGIYSLIAFSCGLCTIISYRRYKTNKWMNKLI